MTTAVETTRPGAEWEPESDSYLTLKEWVRELRAQYRGKNTNLATLYRWTNQGCRGEVLHSLQFGGTRVVSRAQMADFFARLTARSSGNPGPADPAEEDAPGILSPAASRRALASEARQLKALGV